MKKVFITGLFSLFVLLSRAQMLQPSVATHDFGEIPQGKPITYTFVLVNHGSDTLRLLHVEASCGCTTPHWSDAPIPPGDSTSMPVTYNAAGEGRFTKSITLFYPKDLHQELYIKGEVWKTPDTSVPLNTGIQLVKQ
jgi:hypothetical protein